MIHPGKETSTETTPARKPLRRFTLDICGAWEQIEADHVRWTDTHILFLEDRPEDEPDFLVMAYHADDVGRLYERDETSVEDEPATSHPYLALVSEEPKLVKRRTETSAELLDLDDPNPA